MINYKFLFLPLLVFAAFGCKNFQTQELTDEHQIALEEPAEKGIPANEYKGGMLFSFKDPINKWWVANSKLSIAKVGDSLKIQLKDCGLKYECWGTELDELLDFSNADVLKVTARAEGGMTPTLGISLKDMDGYDTSLDRPSNRIEKSDDYIEYYFNYKNKWTHWEGKKPVDPAAIIEILFFVNPGQMNWTGTIYIDDIEVITADEMPSEEELKKARRARRDAKRKAAQQKSEGSSSSSQSSESEKEEETAKAMVTDEVSTESEKVVSKSTEESDNIADVSTPIVIKEKSGSAMIDDFSGELNHWWESNKSKIKIDKSGEQLKVALNGVGPAFDSFGKSFSSIDFTKTPVLRVKVKAEGEQPGDLRVDLKDVNGFVTNSKPNVKVFKVGTEFVEYYFDFTEKFLQNYPNVQTVNASNIIEVVFFVNPGGKAFSGTIYLDDIEAISLEQFKKVK